MNFHLFRLRTVRAAIIYIELKIGIVCLYALFFIIFLFAKCENTDNNFPMQGQWEFNFGKKNRGENIISKKHIELSLFYSKISLRFLKGYDIDT